MTRKQAKARSLKKELEIIGGRKINGYLDSNKKNKLIDDIYDYFENRSCESCKYSKQDNPIGVVCKLNVIENRKPMYLGAEHINSRDFCCNKYEIKD